MLKISKQQQWISGIVVDSNTTGPEFKTQVVRYFLPSK